MAQICYFRSAMVAFKTILSSRVAREQAALHLGNSREVMHGPNVTSDIIPVMQGKEMMSRTQQSPPPPNRKYIGSLWSYSLKTLLFLDTLNSSHAMVLLPLACEPLEYLRGRFSNEEKHQDRVCRIFLYKNFVWHAVSSYAGSEILPDRGTVHKRTVISVMISVTKQIKLRRVDLESVASHIG